MINCSPCSWHNGVGEIVQAGLPSFSVDEGLGRPGNLPDLNYPFLTQEGFLQEVNEHPLDVVVFFVEARRTHPVPTLCHLNKSPTFIAQQSVVSCKDCAVF